MKRPRAVSGFKPLNLRQLMDSQLALCPSFHFIGPKVVGYLTQWQSSGLVPELLVRLLRPTRSLARLPFIFDGSQDWVIAHNDVVAGSNPASGTKCRSSSVVEHVFPVRLLYVGLSAGRRLWVLVDPAAAVQLRSAAQAAVV